MTKPESTPLFQQPENPNVRLWRYVDFAKFVAMLERGGLWFARLDQLGDPFEGSTPAAAAQFWKDMIAQRPDREAIAKHNEGFLREMVRLNRNAAYASCWHLRDHESNAMWAQYAKVNAGIALQTTYARLRGALPENAALGMVRYIDYESEMISLQNILGFYMHKRREFEDEREVRALVWAHEFNPATQQPFVRVDASVLGLNVPIDIQQAIENIVVAPGCQGWFHGLINSVLARYQVALEVQRSELERQPIL